jgi:hypothetical protein
MKIYAELTQWKSVRSMDKKPCDNKMETVYARGGRGNAKLVGFSTNREAKITLQDSIFDNKAIAMLTGNDLVNGVQKVDRNEILTVTSNTISLSKTPQGAIVSVFKLNADGTNGTEYTLGTPASNPTDYSVNGKVLTFNAAVLNGTQFRVYYQVNTATDAKMIKVTSDQFGKAFRVVLDVLVVDQFTQAAYEGQLRIPNAKFQDNFNLSFSADGDPAVLDLNMEVLKAATSADMWQLVVYDDDAIV